MPDRRLMRDDPAAGADGSCSFCGRCLPCPKGIPIPELLRLSAAAPDGKNIPAAVRQHYGEIPRTAGRCVACKQCESRCPHFVPVVKHMRRLSRRFGR